jgi:hypothetical protein
MHCIEALHKQLEACEPCRFKAKIIEFEKLPVEQRKHFERYVEERDFILYCEKCEFYRLLGGD